jgi:hypothetical protein
MSSSPRPPGLAALNPGYILIRPVEQQPGDELRMAQWDFAGCLTATTVRLLSREMGKAKAAK